MMRRITSPTPMGRTPGHLSSGIKLELLYASRKHNSCVAIKIVNFANDLQMSFDVDLNDVRMRLHSFESNPEGPWLPCVLWPIYVLQMR